MKQFLITMAGVAAGLFLFLFVIPFVLIASIGASIGETNTNAQVRVPNNTILTLDLRGPITDQRSMTPFAFEITPSTLDIVTGLKSAIKDERVKAVFVRANEYGMPPAQAEEVHDALLAFREAGKPVIAHAQGFEGTTLTNYVAAAAASEIWLQDTASFASAGLASETLFYGGLFEKYDVDADFVQFHEYKNAANVYTQSDYTDAHREATMSLLQSLYDQSLSKIAAARSLNVTELRNAIESAPHSAETALEAGLVDKLGQYSEARDAIEERVGGEPSMLDVSAYARSVKSKASGPVIAVIGGQGAVLTGEASVDPFGSGDGIFSDTISEAIFAAAEDEEVAAIVLRVDSPGGSAIASDQIWHAITKAQEAGKPVVASFATLAASGGYYISASADQIVAMPTTITGSIGVLGGKIGIDGALNRVGLNIEGVSVGGDYASAYSYESGFSDTQRQAFRARMNDVYEDFVGRVSRGRAMSFDEAEAVARGRVWTGSQALERGLVDKLGGYHVALDTARELAGIAEEDSYQIRQYPAEKTPFEAFSELFGASAEQVRLLRVLSEIAAHPHIRALLNAERSARPDENMVYSDITVR
jgi:protease IV